MALRPEMGWCRSLLDGPRDRGQPVPLAAATGWVAEKIWDNRLLLSDSSWPEGFGGALVCVLGAGGLGSFCEEMLFRGYILAAYERSGWRALAGRSWRSLRCSRRITSHLRALSG